MEDCKELTHCVCCDSHNLRYLFDLGHQPPANEYHEGRHLTCYPLAIRLCHNCFHVQLSHSVDPKILFSNYAYLSGISQTMKDYFKKFAADVMASYPQAKTVLDIACNDGSQLDEFKILGLQTTGIEPSQIDNANHNYIHDFFPRPYITQIKYDIIVAQNILAHVPDPYTFLMACKDMMHDESVLYVQTSQANMIHQGQFDTIYHEHISFFNINSIQKLLNRSGLFLNHASLVPVHGESYLFRISKKDTQYNPSSKYIWQQFYYFPKMAYDFHHRFTYFMKDIEGVIGYGSSAKGINLMNFTGWKPEMIIDDTPAKQGRYTPGTNIKVQSNNILHQIKEDRIFMPMAWNFYDEIKAKIKNLRPDNNDKFIRFYPGMEIES